MVCVLVPFSLDMEDQIVVAVEGEEEKETQA
jgi:hypothetical protein